MGLEFTMRKRDRVRVHQEKRVDYDKKSDGVRVFHEKKSDGVRVHHEKERWSESLP